MIIIALCCATIETFVRLLLSVCTLAREGGGMYARVCVCVDERTTV